jgi:hypothetical protein
MPRYTHDCKECVFVGEDTPRDPKEGKVYVDVYIHMGWREGIGFITRRWGSGKYEKEEKSLIKIVNMEPGVEQGRWVPARNLAVKKGYRV